MGEDEASVISSEGEPVTQSAEGPNAEDLAAQILGAQEFITRADVLKVFELLPKVKPPRGNDASASSFATGAFARVKVGLRSNVAVYPTVARLFAKFVQQELPGHYFTSIVVFDGVSAQPHRDSQNAFTPNAVMAITNCGVHFRA